MRELEKERERARFLLQAFATELLISLLLLLLLFVIPIPRIYLFLVLSRLGAAFNLNCFSLGLLKLVQTSFEPDVAGTVPCSKKE